MKRTIPITFYTTPEEKERIISLVTKVHLPLSSYCRMILLKEIKKEDTDGKPR